MGFAKDRQIQEDEQGWQFSAHTICYRCLCDPYLRAIVREQADQHECSFCGWVRRHSPNSIALDDIMEIIGNAIFQYYDRAENHLGYDHEDGYFGTTYETWDLIRYEIPTISHKENVLETIIDLFEDCTWCDRYPYSLSGAEQYDSSWAEFCERVKHQVRYFFDSTDEPDIYSETIPVPQLLDDLRDIIDEAGLVIQLPAGTEFYRVRAHYKNETCSDWKTLGPPPPSVSVSNRMSAAGISVFYAAMDMSTARREASVSLWPTDRRRLTGAKWTSSRPLNVLDLTKLPPIPSFFAGVRYDRDHLIFLRNFVENITEPVVHDGRERTEYVPSQIVTEYFRLRYRTQNKESLHGIVYPSARDKGGRSIVIFVSQDDLNPRRNYPLPTDPAPLLALDPVSIRRLRVARQAHRNNGKFNELSVGNCRPPLPKIVRFGCRVMK